MQMLQIMPAMAFLAAEAKGMMIGPNILILPLLNPMHVAEEAATLDVLTGGNYVLGAGLGYREPEFTAFGIPLSERAGRFSESVALMRKLWAGGRITHEGKFFTVRDAGISVKPVRTGGPPIYVAGLADSAVRRAARIGDAWLIANACSIQEVMPQMATYRAALSEYGRVPLEFPIARECYVGSSRESAYEECRAALEYKYAAYAAWGMTSPLDGISFDDFARDRFIIGDKESVKDEILRYVDLLGVDHFIMRSQWPGLEQDKVLGSIRRLGEIFAGLQ
jgi:alkanesulfonate monooxygenase SsuD/methylene tetrahydromethanopterin reductase-like flavin-dependent oxidoreductase (luciferase family)